MITAALSKIFHAIKLSSLIKNVGIRTATTFQRKPCAFSTPLKRSLCLQCARAHISPNEKFQQTIFRFMLNATQFRLMGTNPNQLKQMKAEKDAKGALISSQISKLRGACRMSNGALEVDPKKNERLASAITSLLKQGLPQAVITRTLAGSKKALVDLIIHCTGPAGSVMVIEFRSTSLQHGKAFIKSVSKKAVFPLTITGDHMMRANFEKKGLVTVSMPIQGKTLDEEEATDLAIEIEAEDVAISGDLLEFTCDGNSWKAVESALRERHLAVVDFASLVYLPLTHVELDDSHVMMFNEFARRLEVSADDNFELLNLTTNFDH